MKRNRAQIDFTPAEIEQLEQLKNLYGTRTRTEAMRQAVRDALNKQQQLEGVTALQKAMEVIDKLSDALIKMATKSE